MQNVENVLALWLYGSNKVFALWVVAWNHSHLWIRFTRILDMNHIFTSFFFFLKQVEHIVSYPQIWTCIKPMIQVLNIYVSRLKNTNAKFTLCIVEIKLLGLDMRNKPKFQCF